METSMSDESGGLSHVSLGTGKQSISKILAPVLRMSFSLNSLSIILSFQMTVARAFRPVPSPTCTSSKSEKGVVSVERIGYTLVAEWRLERGGFFAIFRAFHAPI
jgi:hypothetical protein